MSNPSKLTSDPNNFILTAVSTVWPNKTIIPRTNNGYNGLPKRALDQPEFLEKAMNAALNDPEYPAQQIAEAIQNQYNWSASAKSLAQAIEQSN